MQRLLKKNGRQLKGLLILSAILISSCSGGPGVFVCVQDVANKTLECAHSETNDKITLPYEKSDNYVCVSPDDFKAIIDWSKLRCD